MKIVYKLLMVNTILVIISCNKLVDIDPPTNTIVTDQVFSSDDRATKAVLGIYATLENQSVNTGRFAFGNSCLSVIGGISSDELAYNFSDATLFPIYKNQILTNNGIVLRNLWAQPYQIIYQTNACLEQLENSKNVTSPLREQLIGEAKFLKALTYFYLVNYFGDVPFLTTTNYKTNTIVDRTKSDIIYADIVNDLESSINSLPSDFSQFNGEHIRATKWAALALLARISLFTGDWEKADQYSSMLIQSGMFSLSSDLSSVFLKNSNEAILQWFVDRTLQPYNVVMESYVTLPNSRTAFPLFYYQPSFINQFDLTDKRRFSWIDSTIYNGIVYYVPYKYKLRKTQSTPNSSPTEYYTVLRLAEQYLIRAEAKAHKNDLSGAAADVNVIRGRAGLGQISFSSMDDAINKILDERKKELMYEWGNRWLDLKRTGKIDQIMTNFASEKGSSWKSEAKLFPIPSSEVLQDPNLSQNPGY